MGYGHPTPRPAQYNVPPQNPPQLTYDSHGFASRIFRALYFAQYGIGGSADSVDGVFRTARSELENDFYKYNQEFRPLMRLLAIYMVGRGQRNDRYLVDHQDLI